MTALALDISHGFRIYTDRFGKPHKVKDGIIIRDRSGAWFVLIHNDMVLFTHPNYAPTVPDLPGGGIDDGENALEAAVRELNEETEIIIKNPKIVETYNQFVHFFADDVPEYWNYEQTFFLVKEGINDLYFHGKRNVPEGSCEWIKISDLHKYQIHYMHKQALKNFGII